jgi:hypothetical protein
VTVDRSGGGKRAGKAEWADRRRPTTRRAGFTVHPETTGGELERSHVGGWRFQGVGFLRVRFSVPATEPGTRLGWGLWFYISPDVEVYIDGFDHSLTLKHFLSPDWGKTGSIWLSGGEPEEFEIVFQSAARTWEVALYGISAGVVTHEFYDQAEADPDPKRATRLLGNMYTYSPEALFISPDVHATVSEPIIEGQAEWVEDLTHVALKSCNRCGRYLPINTAEERNHLSFSNHCTSKPCTHSTFGRLRDVLTGEVLRATHGFQLECRFCKKFTVNAAHNPQRTASQMKEDAARRRHFELLLTELYGESLNLMHRRLFDGRELAESVWERFDGRCFKCGTQLATQKDMHLDHTRPLALLWQLDETATCLCATDNSAKRDRPPSEFYDEDELSRLSEITGVPLAELQDPSPNVDALTLLAQRLDWFFDEFLQRPELQAEHDGKLPADLVVKALQKAIDRADGFNLDLSRMYDDRRSGQIRLDP